MPDMATSNRNRTTICYLERVGVGSSVMANGLGHVQSRHYLTRPL